MLFVILIMYDQLMFRPLVACTDRFRVDADTNDNDEVQDGAWSCSAGRN